MTWPEQLALAFGVVYINPMHNVVQHPGRRGRHRAVAHARGARTYGWLLAVGYGAAFVYGLIAIDEDWDFLNLNWAVVGLVIALGKVRTVRTERGADHSLRTNR